MPVPPAQVVVAGAGVTGACIALELVRQGLNVTLCDPTMGQASASAIAGGMLAPAMETYLDPVARPHLDLMLAARNLWPALAEQVGIDLNRQGNLARGSQAWIGDLMQYLQQRSIACHRQGADLSVSSDWQLDAALALQGLQTAAQAQGVVLLGSAVTGFEAGVAHLSTGGVLAADHLVWATGAGPIPFIPEFETLTPIRGHILAYPGEDGQQPAVIRGQEAYVCAIGRTVLGGATMEFGKDEARVDMTIAKDLHRRIGALEPWLEHRPWTARVGVRASTPDGLPLVGRSQVPGVLVALGMRRNGWVLAPLVARIISDTLLSQHPGPWAAALGSQRFFKG